MITNNAFGDLLSLQKTNVPNTKTIILDKIYVWQKYENTLQKAAHQKS